MSRTIAGLACLTLAACDHAAIQHTAAANSASATPTVQSTVDPTPPDPLYRFVNDTSATFTVTGCAPACPLEALAPGDTLDFAMGHGRLEFRRSDGLMRCANFVNGIAPLTPAPRETLKISSSTSATAC
jgi:glucose/arabinose dehydrogenase